MSDAASAEVRVATAGGRFTVAVAGDLVLETIESVRVRIESGQPPAAATAGGITLDLAGVRRLDASGVSLAVYLFRLAHARGVPFECTGLEGERRVLVELALRGQDPQPVEAPHGVVREVGIASITISRALVDLVRFAGEVSVVSARMVRRPSLLRQRDVLSAMARHGTDAVPVVSLLGFLIGAIIAFQTYDPMAKYGAKLQVADVVGVSIVRELGPLITAILLAGRSGSAFAAEIGAMKVMQELDALRTFGIDPVRFLVVPRMLAVLLVTPLLSMWASALGILGGFVILGPKGIPFMQYWTEIQSVLTVGGLLQGLAKAAVFAILISAIGCLAGLRTGEGPGSVGLSTTKAVVAGIVAIIVADAILGSFFFTLGI
ncbi:MAG: ABC transporter permease [Planctomycetota bacterium]